MSTPRAIQATLNPFATKGVWDGIISVVNGNFITVNRASLAGVRFLLFSVLNSVSFTQALKLLPQTVVGDLDKVLVIPFANANFLFPAWIDPDNQGADLVSDTLIDNQSSCLIQVIPNPIIAILQQLGLLISQICNPKPVFDRLKLAIKLVVEILAKSAQCFEGKILSLAQTTYLILLSQVHSSISLICFYSSEMLLDVQQSVDSCKAVILGRGFRTKYSDD